ncbi:MAG: DUF11 domain-containing protein, partial [Chloroflexi bacterium]|nr:DUF11 domain-containing protein [Chloroflexota bacterium]
RIQDSNPANNTATVATAVVPATDLTVSVSDDPDPVKVGGEVTYTVTVTNNGYADAENVVVNNYLQGAVNLVGTTGCVEVSGTLPVVCTLGTVDEGDSKTFTVRVNVTAAGAVSHRAEVTSSTLESDPDDEEANESTTVN